MSGIRRWWRRDAAAAAPLNLALQGGGAHGAFTWGVLDALLADARVTFEGLSGSSAGAMNAVVLADGWARGGRDGARESLAAFWTRIGQQMPFGMVVGQGDAVRLSPASKWMADWVGAFAPAQINPFDVNPLRDLLRRQIDFERLRAAAPFKLFVGTTQANTGKLRLFREHELTLDVLLASACLPRVHRAVTIDGEPYWDGGYSANPAIFPLFADCDAGDILLVLLAPLVRTQSPHSADEIATRIVELGFSTHLMREMGTFVRAARLAGEGPGWFEGRLERRLRRTRFHMIDSSQLASLERTDTKLLAHGPFLELLREQGRERAQAWLDEHLGGVGRRSTVDIERWFG